MRKLIPIILFFVSNLSCGQDQQIADSLKQIYNSGDFERKQEFDLLENIGYYEPDPKIILEYSDILIRKADGNAEWLFHGYLQKGNGYRYLGQFDDAFSNYYKALEIASSSNNSTRAGVAYTAIADTYSILEDSKNAVSFYRKGIKEIRKSNEPEQLASVIVNAGDEYLNINKLDSALLFFIEAKKIFQESENQHGYAYAQGNIGLVFASQHYYDQAESNLRDATEILEELGDVYGISAYQILLADIYLKKEYLSGALIHANIGYEYATKYDLKEQIRDASKKLSEIYESLSKSGEAISFLKTYMRYSDSLTNPSIIHRMGEIRREFEHSEEKKTETAYTDKNEITETRPTYYALVMGIDDYQFNGPKLADLDQPVTDALSLKQILTENYTFEEDNIIVLKNPVRSTIINALEAISATITPKDNLLIFYAGHGVWDDRLKLGYWLPSDAKLSSKANWVSNSTIRDYVSGLTTKHTLLITDACFSGSIFKTRSVNLEESENTLKDQGFVKVYKLPSRKAMTSGTLQTVPDQSKFMKYLIQRLASNNKAYFSARQLFTQVETAVINNTRNVPQFGTIQNAGDEGGDFIFIRKR